MLGDAFLKLRRWKTKLLVMTLEYLVRYLQIILKYIYDSVFQTSINIYAITIATLFSCVWDNHLVVELLIVILRRLKKHQNLFNPFFLFPISFFLFSIPFFLFLFKLINFHCTIFEKWGLLVLFKNSFHFFTEEAYQSHFIISNS